MAVELRDYQQVGVDFLYERRSAGLFDEMGTGKSRQALATIDRIGSNTNLIVAPKIVAKHWTREIGKVYGNVYTPFIEDDAERMDLFHNGEAAAFVALGTPKQREEAVLLHQLFKTKFPSRPSFLITNYHNLKELRENGYDRWGVRIMDEAHAIKNHESVYWRAAKPFNVFRDYLLTGTPMSQGPRDLWAYLNIIDEDSWPHYWPYVRKYLQYQKLDTGVWIGGPKNPKALRDTMQQFVIRRLKKDVLPELVKSRIRYDVTPNAKQLKAYNEIAVDFLSETDDGGLVLIDNGAVKTVRLRQLLVAPQILGYAFGSATLDAVKEIVTSCGTPSAVFTTFHEAFPFIKAVLPRDYEVYEVAGGMTYEHLDDVVQSYERSATDKKVMLATTQMSQGYELLCASHAIFAGMDWSPMFNGQSEDRLSRLGNSNHVTCHYIVNEGTVEIGMVIRLTEKIEWGNQSIRPELLIRGSEKFVR